MTVTSNIHAPFVKPAAGSTSIMLDVLIAMLAPMVWSAYVFGARAITVVIIALIFAAVPDYLIDRFVLKKYTEFDFSSLITGALVGFCLPASVPLWLPAIASLIAVFSTKIPSGGIGKNLFNPAASGICVSYLLFGKYMTVFTKPFVYLPAFSFSVNADLLAEARVATSLDLMRDGKIVTSSIADYFYGLAPGTIGAISVAALALSLLYLLVRRVVGLGAPMGYIMAIMVLTFFTAYADSEPVDFSAMQIFSGGIALICVFMLGDYSTAPSNMAGKIIFGAVCAAFTVAIRYYGMVHYGEFFAVLAANMLVPVIEKITCPRVYGTYIRRNQDG